MFGKALNNSKSLGSGIIVRRGSCMPERIWQSSSVIINSQTGNGVERAVRVNWVGGWRHNQKGWPREFEDSEKEVSWSSTVESSSWVFRIWWDQISLVLDRQRWVEILETAKCAARGREVSIVWFVTHRVAKD